MTFLADSTKDTLAMITSQQAARRATSASSRKHVPLPPKAPAQSTAPARPIGKSIPASKPSKKEANIVEPNITVLGKGAGRIRFRVQLRRTVDGEQHSLCKTFGHLKNAKAWRNKKEAEIELHGFPVKRGGENKVTDLIELRLRKGRKLERSATQTLKSIQKHEFGQTNGQTLTQQQIYEFAELLLNDERAPQTVACIMTHLSRTLHWAHERGVPIPVEVVSMAMKTLWDDGILARSEERERRPELYELDQIMDAISGNKRQTIPVEILMAFALFSARRLSEICSLRWDDLRISDSENDGSSDEPAKILVRNMKHPRKKRGNNVWCVLPNEALDIILAMPKSSEFIFPYNPRSVGTAYRRHRDKVGVKDLRFHDFRHEAITRHFEMGMPAAFVAKISGHKNGGCLHRYEHVQRQQNKLAGWPWLERVLESCRALHRHGDAMS